MTLSAYREVQVGFEPCTSKIRGNSLTTKATTKCFRICIFLYYIKYLIGNKCTKPCAQNHGFKPMVLCMSQAKPCAQKPWF